MVSAREIKIKDNRLSTVFGENYLVAVLLGLEAGIASAIND